MIEYLLDLLGFILLIPMTYLVFRYGKHLHKNETSYYRFFGLLSLILVISALVIQIDPGMEAFRASQPALYALFFQGHTAFALYVLVMFAGAFKNRSEPKKRLMSVRRELAIIGFFLLIPHMVLLIWFALSNLNPTGTIAFLLMIPLFITSFKEIRKKMHPLSWRKLHKLAYGVYAVIFLHIASITIVFNLINNSGFDLIFGFIRFALYLIVFGFYTYLKFKNYILKSDEDKPQTN